MDKSENLPCFHCGKTADWVYMPSSSLPEVQRWACDDHVFSPHVRLVRPDRQRMEASGIQKDDSTMEKTDLGRTRRH